MEGEHKNSALPSNSGAGRHRRARSRVNAAEAAEPGKVWVQQWGSWWHRRGEHSLGMWGSPTPCHLIHPPWPNLPGAEGSGFLGERYRNVNVNVNRHGALPGSKLSFQSQQRGCRENKRKSFSNPPHREGASPSSHPDPLLPPLRGDALKIGHPTAVHPMHRQ